MSNDWVQWHESYDEPGSALSLRLSLVQARISAAIEEAGPGEIRVVSMCAGQGRDLIGVLAEHPRRGEVTARLVELDEHNASVAAGQAGAAGLDTVQVVCGDASISDAYRGATPAKIVLACGVFGNIPDSDIARTVDLLPMLCASGATVVWTRHRLAPDLTPRVRTWFAKSGFEEIGFDSPADFPYIGVGAHRWLGGDGVLGDGVRFFEFVKAPYIEP